MAISTTTKKPLSLPLLAFITTYLTLFHTVVHSAETVSFSFNKFEPTQRDLILQGVASIPSGSNGVQLTRANSQIQRQGTVGRVLYSAPIRIWAQSTVLASFETTFTFSISRPAGNNPPADGLAFFLAPHDTTIPSNSAGALLGLFSSSLAINNSRNEIVGFKASPNQVVAVEFDTYPNLGLGDPNYRHIGIDVNSIRSKATARWDWQNGRIATAHITYNSLSGRLSAVTYYPNSTPVTVAYDVKLNEVLPEWVRVGFSASTGDYSQQATLLSWSFSSSLKRTDVAEADDDGYIASVV